MEKEKEKTGMRKSKNIRKWYDDLIYVEKRTEKSKRQLICACDHQEKGYPAIRMTNEHFGDGSPVYRCKKCGKKLNINPIDQKKLEEAVDLVSDACDVIKMLAKPENEQDEKLLKMVAKVQYRITDKIPDMYRATKEKGRRGNKKNKNRSGNNSAYSDQKWGRPTTR